MEKIDLEFVNGIASTDLSSLTKGIEILGLPVPVQFDTLLDEPFNSMVSVATRNRESKVKIDTIGALTWAKQSMGTRIQSYTKRIVDGTAIMGEISNNIAKIPTISGVSLMATEITLEELKDLGHYELFELAGKLTKEFKSGKTAKIKFPSQDVDWTRNVSEIKSLFDEEEISRMRVEVKAEISKDYSSRIKTAERITIGEKQEILVLGEKGPIVWWLVSPNSENPFCVVASTDEAWKTNSRISSRTQTKKTGNSFLWISRPGA